MVRCISVPKEKGEDIRARLMAAGILNRDAKIRTADGFIIIPILSDSFEDFTVSDEDLETVVRKETDYRKVAVVPDELRELLPNSFDMIGDIAVIKLDSLLTEFAENIGEALLFVSPSLRAVFLDDGVKGEMRVRDIKRIAGMGTSETIHKEFGVSMTVDPGKAYFNPRLSTERSRVASLVKDGEIIIDMFAGVAPFPLIISKHSNPKIVYSIDLNPDAVELMCRNISSNSVSNIIPICGDASLLISELPDADRIIMNLPQSAYSFLECVLKKLRKCGMIHMHMITERDTIDQALAGIEGTAASLGIEVSVNIIELKTYSPSMSVYVFDVKRIT